MSRIPKGFISLGLRGDMLNLEYVSEIKEDKYGKILILKSGEELRVNNYIRRKENYEAY